MAKEGSAQDYSTQFGLAQYNKKTLQALQKSFLCKVLTDAQIGKYKLTLDIVDSSGKNSVKKCCTMSVVKEDMKKIKMQQANSSAVSTAQGGSREHNVVRRKKSASLANRLTEVSNSSGGKYSAMKEQEACNRAIQASIKPFEEEEADMILLRVRVAQEGARALLSEAESKVSAIKNLLTDKREEYLGKDAEILLKNITYLVSEVERKTDRTVVAVNKGDVKGALRGAEGAENIEQQARVFQVKVHELHRQVEQESRRQEANNEEEVPRCSICLESFKKLTNGQVIQPGNCIHRFHKACILQWVNTSQDNNGRCSFCPYCKEYYTMQQVAIIKNN